MKKILRYLFLITVITLASFTGLRAQQPPHPGETNGGMAVSGDRIGGTSGSSAPIGEGTLILFALSAAYALKTVYNFRTKTTEELG